MFRHPRLGRGFTLVARFSWTADGGCSCAIFLVSQTLGGPMGISGDFLPEFDSEMAASRRTLERIPEDKLTWKPHEKSMPLGRLAGHIAELVGLGSAVIKEDGMDFAARRAAQPAASQPWPNRRSMWWNYLIRTLRARGRLLPPPATSIGRRIGSSRREIKYFGSIYLTQPQHSSC